MNDYTYYGDTASWFTTGYFDPDSKDNNG
jgi:ankyrin repeat protein